MAVEFKFNGAGIVELMKSEELKADMDERVKRVAETAKAIAPYSARAENEQHYKDAISSGTFDDGDRNTGYVQAAVPWACAVEVEHRTLGDALGLANGDSSVVVGFLRRFGQDARE